MGLPVAWTFRSHQPSSQMDLSVTEIRDLIYLDESSGQMPMRLVV